MTIMLDDYYEAQQGGKKMYGNARVFFSTSWEDDTRASEEKGYPVKREVEIININNPGQTPRALAAEEKHRREYPAEYQAFKLNQEPATNGFPLEHWCQMTVPIVAELKRLDFRTLEQLAEASEDAKRKLGPLAKYIKEAQTFLDAANSGQAQTAKLKKIVDKLESKVKSLEDQNALLIARISSSTGGELASVSS